MSSKWPTPTKLMNNPGYRIAKEQASLYGENAQPAIAA
jgi:hypothetical protein